MYLLKPTLLPYFGCGKRETVIHTMTQSQYLPGKCEELKNMTYLLPAHLIPHENFSPVFIPLGSWLFFCVFFFKFFFRLAELFEQETENYLKMDPDPFDERHPSRADPDCALGHMLKVIFRKDAFMNKVI